MTKYIKKTDRMFTTGLEGTLKHIEHVECMGPIRPSRSQYTPTPVRFKGCDGIHILFFDSLIIVNVVK